MNEPFLCLKPYPRHEERSPEQARLGTQLLHTDNTLFRRRHQRHILNPLAGISHHEASAPRLNRTTLLGRLAAVLELFILKTELFLSFGYYLQTLPLPPTVDRRGSTLSSLRGLVLKRRLPSPSKAAKQTARLLVWFLFLFSPAASSASHLGPACNTPADDI